MSSEGSKDRGTFLANYKNLTVAGGGRAAVILAIGVPIAVLILVGIMVADVPWPGAIGLTVFGVIAFIVAIWLIVGPPERDSPD